MITYEEILAANKGLSSIEVKGKDYIQVVERVKAFRKLFPAGFLTTKILTYEDGVVVMEAEAGYFDGDRRVVLSNGLAYEKETSSILNKTSLIENAQTSAVGRALAFLGIGIDSSICSAEELVNAINHQDESQKPKANIAFADKQEKPVIDLAEVRAKLDVAIKAKTKDLSRDEKLRFINEIIMPTLNGERNWKLCQDITLLQNLLIALEKTTA